MNLTVHLPHVASWAAFFTVVAWTFVPTTIRATDVKCPRYGAQGYAGD
jgi:hypothetical protein